MPNSIWVRLDILKTTGLTKRVNKKIKNFYLRIGVHSESLHFVFNLVQVIVQFGGAFTCAKCKSFRARMVR